MFYFFLKTRMNFFYKFFSFKQVYNFRSRVFPRGATSVAERLRNWNKWVSKKEPERCKEKCRFIIDFVVSTPWKAICPYGWTRESIFEVSLSYLFRWVFLQCKNFSSVIFYRWKLKITLKKICETHSLWFFFVSLQILADHLWPHHAPKRKLWPVGRSMQIAADVTLVKQ